MKEWIGGDDYVELGQDFVTEVQRAILQDIDFDAGEQADSGDAFLSGADFLDLSERALFVHAICDGDGFGMVGEGDVFIAEGFGGFTHFFNGVASVGGGGVHLEVAANVLKLYELRHFVIFGGFDFAGHFAKFRLDVIEAELGVDFFFGLAGDNFAAFQRGHRVFIQRPAHVEGAAAEGDVVRFGAGEIKESGAEVFFREHADVHLESAAEQDADFVFAVREGLIDSRIFQNVFGDGVHVFLFVASRAHGDKKIDVADGFASAAQRAGRGDRLDCRGGFRQFRIVDIGSKLLGFVFRGVEFETASRALRRFGGL